MLAGPYRYRQACEAVRRHRRASQAACRRRIPIVDLLQASPLPLP
jgi:hypothetical protein